MTDYAAIVFAGHLGLIERAQMIAGIFNESAANAGDYMTFKQQQDDRASAAMTRAIALGQSRVAQGMLEIEDKIADFGPSMTAKEIALEQEKLDGLKSKLRAEKTEVERLKPEMDSLSQLFTILALAEAKMQGFDPETLRHTKDAKGYLTGYQGQLSGDESGIPLQEARVKTLEDLLRATAAENTAKAEKAAFGDYLKSGPVVAAPMPAPMTAKFRKKTP
ncbi:MAG: hypothetical protein JNM12_14935 [Alphaproteobacteria bacterium]|nr:hypothetical protein [Alphaproteobacteria bacterium]